jgi:hypothetical protein
MSTTNLIRTICKVLLFGAAELLCSFAAIWFAYSTNAQIKGGYFTRHEAIFWTFQMAIVTALLVSLAIVFSLYLLRAHKAGRGALADFLIVALTLIGYTALNFFWRDFWNGDLSKPAFLPLWNDVNSHFFYEWNWLSYLLFVSPVVAMVSAVLSLLLFRRKRTIKPSLNAKHTTIPAQP